MPEKKSLLEVPPELVFSGPFDHVITTYMTLTNISQSPVCFLVKTTVPNSYCVRPNRGILNIGDSKQIEVMLQPLEKVPPDAKQHKFLVQSCVAPSIDVSDLESVWKNVKPDELTYNRLVVTFVDNTDSKSNIECEICTLEFSSVVDNQIPRILQCGHSICQSCASKLAKNCVILCPFCRNETNVSSVASLPKNFALLQAIDQKTLRVPPLEIAKLRQQLSCQLSKLEEQVSKTDKSIKAVGRAQLSNLKDGREFQERKDSIVSYYASIRETINALENEAIGKLHTIADMNVSKNALLVAELSEILKHQNLKIAELKLSMEMDDVELATRSLTDSGTECAVVKPAVLDVALTFPEIDKMALLSMTTKFPSNFSTV